MGDAGFLGTERQYIMKKILFAGAAAAVAFAAQPAMAQGVPAAPDETLVINLSGSVPSECDLDPEGSTNYSVDMLDFGNQGGLVISYSCNSPYSVSLQSLNGGMRHDESNGLVNIPYGIESIGFDPNGVSATNTSSTDMHTTPAVIANVTSWQNIAANLGVRYGELDLNFANNLNEYAVAGTYADELTITLSANL